MEVAPGSLCVLEPRLGHASQPQNNVLIQTRPEREVSAAAAAAAIAVWV